MGFHKKFIYTENSSTFSIHPYKVQTPVFELEFMAPFHIPKVPQMDASVANKFLPKTAELGPQRHLGAGQTLG